MYWPSVQGWQFVWVSRLCRTVLWTALPAGHPAPSPVVPWWGPCCQTPLCTLHKDTSYNTCQQPVIHLCVHCTRIQVTAPVNNQSYTSVYTAQGYKSQHLSTTSIHLCVHCKRTQVTTPVNNLSVLLTMQCMWRPKLQTDWTPHDNMQLWQMSVTKMTPCHSRLASVLIMICPDG